LRLFCPIIAAAQELPPYIVTHTDTSSIGYYFLCPIQVRPNPEIRPMLLILDARGDPVYHRPFHASGAGDFKLHDNGLMSFYHQGQIHVMDSTFTVVDSVTTVNGIRLDTHDFLMLSNGHMVLLGFEDVPMDLSGYRMFNRRGSPGDSHAIVECGVVQQLDGDRNVVFEWRARDHYAFDDVDEFFLTDSVDVDWTHFNAIEVDHDGGILVSPRFFNEITKIDRATGSIIWRLGGKRNQFTFTNDADAFLAQHDIRRIASGNITLFDNGRNDTRVHPAAGKEYRLDESSRTAALVWSHVEDSSVFSRAIGNTQRLPNGNTLVNYGLTDRLPAVFTVVDPSGGKVFELTFIDTLRSYRVFNYPHLPWDLPRPVITCFDSGGVVYLDAGPGHASYRWSTGDSTRVIRGVIGDTFTVSVPFGQGGTLHSTPYAADRDGNACRQSSAGWDRAESGFTIEPNFAESRIAIRFERVDADGGSIDIVDPLGCVRLTSRHTPDLQSIVVDVSSLARGLYFVRLDRNIRPFVKR